MVNFVDLCLNPLSTGKSVQTQTEVRIIGDVRLNPLSTGKSVQTKAQRNKQCRRQGLNPLSTGKSVQTEDGIRVIGLGQS